ncbi:MAG TPA: SpoVG family protein [Planctomycetota bacterium]|nr:SpoVG family protein [Planctomycetota bacterium]
MEISEVRIKLILNRNDKLRAFCSVTLDNAFVIRDLKIIEGAKGPFVAMPSRKLTDRCMRCGMKNHLRAKFCNECGNRLSPDRAASEPDGRSKLHADIAHPISAPAREAMQKRILASFAEEVEKSKLPGYKPVEIYESSEGYEPE